MSDSKTRLLILSALTVMACAGSGLVGPADRRVRFAEVSPGDSLAARLVIRNPSSDTLRLVSGSSCVATLVVTFGGRQVPLEGTQFVCLTIIMQFAIAPGGAR